MACACPVKVADFCAPETSPVGRLLLEPEFARRCDLVLAYDITESSLVRNCEDAIVEDRPAVGRGQVAHRTCKCWSLEPDFGLRCDLGLAYDITETRLVCDCQHSHR